MTEMTEKIEMKPCPFCGKTLDMTDPDTLHPSGIYWRPTEFGREYLSHKNRTEDSLPCWQLNCHEVLGGCGVEINGDSRKEVITKWNKRV